MNNKVTIIFLFVFLAVSGCGKGNILGIIPPAEKTMKFPGQYYWPDRQVCAQALNLVSVPPEWETIPALSDYVNEARRRGLSPQQCMILLGLEPD